MQGRNICFPKVGELIACLELINSSLRMTFLQTHFGPGDLPALLDADPKPIYVKDDYFIQILTKLSSHDQLILVRQELDWIGKHFSTANGLILLLKNLSPETWPIIVTAVSPALLSRDAFELVVISRHFETPLTLANAHSVSHLFPEIATFEALRANQMALLSVGIYHTLPMLVKHRSLVQSYDDYKALVARLGENDRVLAALGKEWWKRELNTLDRVCAELDNLAKDEGEEWFKEMVVPHVKTANSFFRLHDGFTVRKYGNLYHARIKCLIDAVLPHLALPFDVQVVLAAFEVNEIDNRKYFTEKFCEIFLKRNPSFDTVIEYLQLFKDCGDKVRIPKDNIDQPAFLVRHYDFDTTIFRTFFRGVLNYLPMVIKKEEDLSSIIKAITPDFNGNKKEFWTVMEAHLPTIISDPERLSAFRKTHGLKNDTPGWFSFFRFGQTEPSHITPGLRK